MTLRANLRNRYRAQHEFAHGVVAPTSLPINLQIALNNSCNFKCVYCSDHRDGNVVPRTRLEGRPWAELEAVIPQIDVLAFHGISEFFVDRQFFDIVARCAAAGAQLSLNTNGSVATPRHVEALAGYPGRIDVNFSMDAATEPTFKRIRGWDFARVLQNIRAYVSAFAARRVPTWTSGSFVIMRSNVDEMVPFVHLAAELGLNEAKFYRLHEYGTLAWKIRAPDGSEFDYRDECTDRLEELHDRNVRAATRAAAERGLVLAIPALYSDSGEGAAP